MGISRCSDVTWLDRVSWLYRADSKSLATPESTELWRASTHDKKRNPCLLLLSMSSPYLIVHGTTYCKYVFKKLYHSWFDRTQITTNQHIIQLINTRTILRLGRIWLSCFNRDVFYIKKINWAFIKSDSQVLFSYPKSFISPLFNSKFEQILINRYTTTKIPKQQLQTIHSIIRQHYSPLADWRCHPQKHPALSNKNPLKANS